MFVVVRNVKSPQQNSGEQLPIETENFKSEYRVKRGDVIKMGRLKFLVKDFRSDSHPAALDC